MARYGWTAIFEEINESYPEFKKDMSVQITNTLWIPSRMNKLS